jgi:hypothetical protein
MPTLKTNWNVAHANRRDWGISPIAGEKPQRLATPII